MRSRRQAEIEHRMVLQALEQPERAERQKRLAEGLKTAALECQRERQMINPVLSPMDELEALIAAGWGDTPRSQIPPDWRNRPAPHRTFSQPRGTIKRKMHLEIEARMRAKYSKQKRTA